MLSTTGKGRAGRLLFSCALAVLLAATSGCGGGTPSTPTGPTKRSGLNNRAWITVDSVSFGGATGNTAIVDINNDASSAVAVSTGTAPTRMALSPDKTKTVVVDPSGHQLITLDNTTESLLATQPAGDAPGSAVIMGDNTTGWFVVRNLGQIVSYNITTGSANKVLSGFSEVRTLILSHNGKKILAFSDDSNVVNVVDTAAQTATAVADPASVFSRPVYAIFSSDDSKAYILSCGPECGGAAGTANVSLLDMTTLTPGPAAPVSAATIGLLDSGNLYVAGTAAAGGRLDVLNATTLVPSKTGVVISAGFHDHMALSNGLLFIGAHAGQNDSSACSNGAQGCLSMFNVASGTVTIETAKGGVTGIQPITTRHVVYVIEGGELVIYDTTTAAPQAKQIDIIGTAVDVKAIDQ